MGQQHICVETWGEYGLFTRPENKVERFTYPVITPSSARGILESIYWKPGVKYEISKIEILSPIRYQSFRRNEVKSKVAEEVTIKKWIRGTEKYSPKMCDSTDERTQRQSIMLKNPNYRIHANVYSDDIKSVIPQIKRRVSKGQCFHQPFFGCKELVAYFGEPSDKPVQNINMDIGYMLYDVFNVFKGDGNPEISVFYAKIENGVLTVPKHNSVALRFGSEDRELEQMAEFEMELYSGIQSTFKEMVED